MLNVVHRIARDIQDFFIKHMDLGSPEARRRCEVYFAEDPSIIARREDLVAQMQKLEMVKVKLYDCGY